MIIHNASITDANNVMILDAIRNQGSLDYQLRIPSATQAGVDSVLRNLTDYRPAWNEFESALINRIGMMIGRSKTYLNPLREFKKGLLEFGDTIEEYQVGLLKAHNYNPDHDYMEKALFGRELVEVQSNFHRINREDFYKLTINEDLLKRAFLSNDGLSKFVSDLMTAPTNSDEWDEFLLMCNLLTQYENSGGFFRITVPGVSDINSTAEEAKRALRLVRQTGELMRFPNTHYNAARMPTFATPDDLILLTSPEFRAAVDVEALAAAFNIDKADIPYRMITLPREHVGIPDFEAILTTSDFFQVYDVKVETSSQFNPINLHTNYFWHHWQVISASRFVPSVMFTTGAGSVIDVSPNNNIVEFNSLTVNDIDGNPVAEVAPGYWYEVVADFDGGGDETTIYGVTYRVDGANSTKTFVSQRGVLKIGGQETANEISVSAWDSNGRKIGAVSISVIVPVEGDNFPDWPTISTPPVEIAAPYWTVAGLVLTATGENMALSATIGGTPTVARDGETLTFAGAGTYPVTVTADPGFVVNSAVAGNPVWVASFTRDVTVTA